MAAANISSAALVGHSMGSLVALNAAARYPDYARSLVLIGSTAPMGVHPDMLRDAADNGHGVIDMLTYWGYSKAAQLGGSETPGLWMAGNTLRLLERAADDLIHIDLAACKDYDAGLSHAEAVVCPTLFILGERDIMTPVRSAEKLISAVAKAQVCVLEGSGHSLMMERPDALLDALISIV
jgi:pimeloyl-ACP methyl ester carboxylesterase